MEPSSLEQSSLAPDLASHLEKMRAEYRAQAAVWGSAKLSDNLAWVLAHIDTNRDMAVLDVAAGTALVGRALAPHVDSVVALDVSPDMIREGVAQAAGDGLRNLTFVEGVAEAMPFADESFDLVVTRFSVHHILTPTAVFAEMARVCRVGGTVVVVDMIASEDAAVAESHNRLERLMDATHTRCLAPSEMVGGLTHAGLTLSRYLSRRIEARFVDWQPHVPIESPGRIAVEMAFRDELKGGKATGMRPFLRDGQLHFVHTWGIAFSEKAR